jgi:formylglycine-generating enzyme required for sulfatase activity
MNATALLLTGAVVGTPGVTLWPKNHPVVRDLPRMVLLESQPFEHRLDGDWRQAGQSTDAPVRTTRIPAPIEIIETSVSTGQWLDCVAAGACLAPGGRADRPICR